MKDCILMRRLETILSDYEHAKHQQHFEEPKFTKKFLISKIIKAYKIPLKSVFTIMNRVIFEHDERFLITNILLNPFLFIVFNDPMISYETAVKINDGEHLTIDDSIKHYAWCYDYFVTKCKSFYVNARHFKNDFIEMFGQAMYKEFLPRMIPYNHEFVTMQEYIDNEEALSTIFLECFQPSSESNDIESFLKQQDTIVLNDEQKDALIKCVTNTSQIICGFPGTGKSTIVNVLKDYLYSHGHIISAIAPTGLAIKNLLSKCEIQHLDICGTIHKMIYNVYPYMDESCFHDDTPSEKQSIKISKYRTMIPTVIIVDEVSMIDMIIMEKLMYYVKLFKAKLILLGDENQLQPVGPGNPLFRITHNDAMRPYICNLTQIMRQDNPALIENIKMIHDGDYLMDNHFDNQTMIKLNYFEFIDPTSKEISFTKLKSFIQKNGLTKNNTQFLTPENHKNCGSTKLNILLQRIYNKNKNIPQTMYKINDLVVRTQNCNDQEQMFANGETGMISHINDDLYSVTILYDSGIKQSVSYQELFEEFTLRYCMTIHKSQGSEYENVVLFMGTPHESSSWKQSSAKKLLYTAVSRTKQRCFIIEKKGILNIAQCAEEKIEPSNFLKN